MSSENLNPRRRSASRARSRSLSKKPPDPAQIPLPPSPPASVQEEQASRKASTRPADEEKTKEKGAKKPTFDESWDKVLKEVARHDEDMIKGWRDDIDTLLVFAGLFSAVVTAFVIESYQWLDEDPADTTVALLTKLILVQVNGSQSVSLEPTPFKPDAFSIRINIFWFLSLIFSLTSALFGLLCKQWVREHQRDTTTRTPGEALALRQLRRDSFEKWGVLSFLSALPILLEVALLLFFVGVLDLLWNRHPVPFAICFTAISLSTGLYFLTTLLPTLMVPRDQKADIWRRRFNQLTYQSICPYKSPQAWLVYRLSSTLLRPLLRIRVIDNFLHEQAERVWDHIKSPKSDWSSFDLWVVRQFDHSVSYPHFSLKVYELRAFEWAVMMFRDSPSMIPHLRNVLETIPASVAMSAVLGRWDMTMWKAVSMDDVEYGLRDPDPSPWDPPIPTIQSPVLQQPEGISFLFHHQYWAMLAVDAPDELVDELPNETKYRSLQRSTGLHFVIPFPVVDALWTHEDSRVRVKSLKLLSLFGQSWEPGPGSDAVRHNGEQVALMQALAKHINRTDRISGLLTSKRGQAFIRYIHNEATIQRTVHHWFVEDVWSEAIRRVQEVGGLPSGYFAPIREYAWDPLPVLPKLDPVRYSIETQQVVQVDQGEDLEIVTSDGVEDTAGVGPSNGDFIRHSQDFNIDGNASQGHHSIGSSDDDIPNREYGVDGVGQSMDSREDRIGYHNVDCDNVRKLRRGGDIDALGIGEQAGMGTLGDASGKGDEDTGGDSYSLRRLNRRASDVHRNREPTEPELDTRDLQ